MKDKIYSDEKELLDVGKTLLTKTLFELYGEQEDYNEKDKGYLGKKLESLHYGISNNTRDEPDVFNLGIEIKANPLRINPKGKLVPKEAVSLGNIDFKSILTESFSNSKYLRKNAKILYNMYLHDEKSTFHNSKFVLVDILSPSDEDLEIIKADWKYIQSKFLKGEADSLSRADTNYLMAVTKSSSSKVRKGYGDGLEARPRAFGYKHDYIKSILDDYQFVDKTDNPYFKRKPGGKRFKLLTKIDKGQIELAVLKKFDGFKGWTDLRIAKHFNESKMFLVPNAKGNLDKARWHNLTSLMLIGEKKRNLSDYIEEFAKSGLTVKTIRVNKKFHPKEEVSFRNQDFEAILTNQWEDSSLYNEMSCKFLWIVFMENDSDYYLHSVKFWKMPDSDLEFLRTKWESLKESINRNDYRSSYFMQDDSFYYLKIKDSKGGQNKALGSFKVTNLSHWFRKEYVQNIVRLNE